MGNPQFNNKLSNNQLPRNRRFKRNRSQDNRHSPFSNQVMPRANLKGAANRKTAILKTEMDPKMVSKMAVIRMVGMTKTGIPLGARFLLLKGMILNRRRATMRPLR